MPRVRNFPGKSLPRAYLFLSLAFPVCPVTEISHKNRSLGHTCFPLLLFRYARRLKFPGIIASSGIPISLACFPGMPSDWNFPGLSLPRAYLFLSLAFLVCPAAIISRDYRFLEHTCFPLLLFRYAPWLKFSGKIASSGIPVPLACFSGMPGNQKSLVKTASSGIPISLACFKSM